MGGMMKVLLAGALVLALVACSSSDSGIERERDEAQARVTELVEQLATANTSVEELEEQLMAAQETGDEAMIVALKARIKELEDAAAMAVEKAEDDALRAKAKTAAALLASLQEEPLATGVLTLVDGKTVAGDGSDVTGTTLRATNDVVGSLGGWQGKQYKHVMKNGPTNTVVLYTNKGPGSSRAWLDVYGTNSNFDKGTNTLATGGITPANVASPSFDVTSGDKNFKVPKSGVLAIGGSYDGANGTYRCTGTEGQSCTATVAAKGFTLRGDGTWAFSPAAGAMVFTPDTGYLAFGWWLRESDDGPMVATIAHNIADTIATGLSALEGKATYSGAAAGKFAIRSTLGGVAEAGHFTANATLTADFSADEITGLLDNFMGGEQVWSVELMKAGIGDGGTFGGISCTTCTTQWTIEDVSEEKGGNWGGTFYGPIAAGKDGAGTPMSANGTFSAEYGSIGHMLGAFGAEKQ